MTYDSYDLLVQQNIVWHVASVSVGVVDIVHSDYSFVCLTIFLEVNRGLCASYQTGEIHLTGPETFIA